VAGRFEDWFNAFLWFDKACDAESSWLTGLKVVPGYAPLHSDPRYPALLRRLGLTPETSEPHVRWLFSLILNSQLRHTELAGSIKTNNKSLASF
jgi:hypothetical protein